MIIVIFMIIMKKYDALIDLLGLLNYVRLHIISTAGHNVNLSAEQLSKMPQKKISCVDKQKE